MKSIKPGRGPSLLSGVVAIAMALFGVIWMIGAASMGAPALFPLFGLLFVGVAIAMGVYNLRNATGKNRYSSFDITDGQEEPDPLQARFGGPTDEAPPEGQGGRFCPYCGARAEETYAFCNHCGKKLP